MRDKKSETRYEFKLNFKEITLFIVGSIGVISLFFIIGIWIGKSLNTVPSEILGKEYLTEKDFPYEGEEEEKEVDISAKGETSYEFQDSLNDENIIPLKDEDKIKIVKKGSTESDNAKKIKKEIDNFSVTKSEPKKAEEAAKPEPKPKAKVAKAKKGRYTVQIASLKSDKAALKLKSRLEKNGYDAYFIATNVKDKGVWFRVRVGNFHTKDEANKMIRDLERKIKMKGMIVRDRRN